MAHRVLIILASCLGVSALAAQTDLVWIGRFQAHPTRILAKFKTDVPTTLSAEAERQAGSRIHKRYKLVDGLVVVEEAEMVALSATRGTSEEERRAHLLSRIEALQKSGLFEYVEPDYIVHAYLTPTDKAFVDGRLWALRNNGQNGGTPGADIGAVQAWDITTGSTNVVVAVIDSGIRYTHQELVNQMWHNPGEIAGNGKDDDRDGYVDDVFGINAITGSGDPFDDNDHGTHVSGTIGAAANDGHPHVGVSWHVRLMGCKFLNAQGFGATSDAITCIDYAVSKGARILNNSWGGGPFERSLFDAINRARNKGVLFVAAAGNDANDNDLSPAYPASYQLDNIIAVAAIDRNDRLADFSNFGRTTVHLGAPGVDIFSSIALSDTEYQSFDGTSMATPHVSGVAALILGQYPGADLDEVRGRILLSTVPIPSLTDATTTGGRLNAYNALTTSGSGVLQVSVDPPSGSTLLSSSSQFIFVKVKDLFGVTNATVTATTVGNTNLTFANDGQQPDALAGDAIYTASFPVPASAGIVTLTLAVSAPGKFGTTNIISYTVVPPPSNDDFANGIKVRPEGLLASSNNKFATTEPGEPFHAGLPEAAASLWWIWTPTNNTNVLIDTTGSAVDTVLAVYTGSSLPTLHQVAATNNVGSQKQAYLEFSAQAGIAYRIAVASVDTNSVGSLRIRIAPGGQLDKNLPEVFISSPPSGLSVNHKVISVSGTAFDPPPNSSGVTEVLLKVNDELASPANGTTNWTASILLQQGLNSIQAVAFDAAGNSSPTATVQVDYIPTNPENDFFANAIRLTGTAGTSSVNNGLATKESGEPLIGGNVGGKSVWWWWQAPADGVLFLTTTNSDFDTLMALFTGTRVDALTPVANNDDAYDGVKFSKIAQAVSSGQSYHIAVDGYDGASGTIKLAYSFTAVPVFNLTINNTAGGSASPSSGLFASNTTVVFTAVPDSDYEFVGWEGDISSPSNPLSVVVTGDLALTATFQPHQFTDGFETGTFARLPWLSGGNTPWIVQSNDVSFGRFAAQSGTIGAGQTSRLILTTSTGVGVGVGYFDYRVSSETNFDFLEFYLNGLLQHKWSGEVSWQTYQFAVPLGTNTFEWRYVKDAIDSSGLDAAFIDNLDLPTVPPSLRLFNPTATGFQIQSQGQVAQTVRIQASTDLVSWVDVSTNAVKNNTAIQFVDPQTTSFPLRFYRAIAP